MFQRFLEESDAFVHFGSEVTDMQKTSNGLWQLYVSGYGAIDRLYDFVILACPVPLFQVPYVHLHVTLVATNASTYSRNALKGMGSDPPTMILSTDARSREDAPSKLNFNSINYVQKAKKDDDGNDEWIVKIFSEEPSAWRDEDLHALFGGAQNVGWRHRHVFNAYPYLQPRKGMAELPPFEIDEGMFYVNAMGG